MQSIFGGKIMAKKLVIYKNPTMSQIDFEIGGFVNEREAAHYRDTHHETAGKPSQIQTGKVRATRNKGMMESELSNASHANETDIIEAMNTTSRPDSFFNSYWFAALVVAAFLLAVFLTN